MSAVSSEVSAARVSGAGASTWGRAASESVGSPCATTAWLSIGFCALAEPPLDWAAAARAMSGMAGVCAE
jgi:hypothetical protein